MEEKVAGCTIGLVLATFGRLPQAERFLRDGRWSHGSFPRSPTLRGRRVGILALGGLGKAIARRLEGFDVAIAYHGRTRQEAVAYPWHPTPQALAAAARKSVVSGKSVSVRVDLGGRPTINRTKHAERNNVMMRKRC